MKLKTAALYLILCLALVISGCGGSSNTGSTGDDAGKQSVGTKKADGSAANFNKISDFSEAWNDLYKQNEAVINKLDEPIMELVTPGLEFITGVQYELLNMENKDGRFEGKLMMAGHPGFMEKKGSKMSFGYDFIRDEDGFGPTMKAGDRLVEDGNCDLGQGTYVTETFTERDGQKIERSYSEFKRLKNGEMICIRATGHSLNAVSAEEQLSNTCTYIKAGKNKYDFVIGKATQGPAFEKLFFIDKNNLSKNEARQMMEAAGYQIDKSGGIVKGVLVVD